jgi:hypothetical protein
MRCVVLDATNSLRKSIALALSRIRRTPEETGATMGTVCYTARRRGEDGRTSDRVNGLDVNSATVSRWLAPPAFTTEQMLEIP